MITVHLTNNKTYEFKGKDLSSSGGADDLFTVFRKYYYDSARTVGHLWWKKTVTDKDYGFRRLMSFKYSLVERVEYSEDSE